MEYLVDRYDTDHKISFPKGTRDWYAMKNWLYFQNAGVGPMQGQASKYHSSRAFQLYFAFSRQSRDHVDLSPAATPVRCRSCGGVIIQYRIWSGNDWLLLVVRRAQCGMIFRYRQPRGSYRISPHISSEKSLQRRHCRSRCYTADLGSDVGSDPIPMWR
jgi:hypothetical protein